jgi:hypothetical protein
MIRPRDGVLLAALATAACTNGVTVPSGSPGPSLSPAPLPMSCDGARGGRAGAQSQLRFLEATDDQVVLTFGPSAEPGEFDVPAFTLEPLEGTSAPRAYRLHVDGSSSTNPDGTKSYTGLDTLEPGGHTVRALHFIDESRRTLSFTVLLEKVTCPFVTSRSYVYGKSPRAQIALTFNNAGSLTLETEGDDFGGAEVGTPIQAVGMGYAPGSSIRIALNGTQVDETAADKDGAFDSGFWTPDREPDLYPVTADDGHGRVGRTTLRVMVRRATH